MNLIEFMLLDGVTPFTVALAIMVMIGFMEGISTLFGVALSGLIDNLLPDSITGVDIDFDAGVDGGVGGDSALSQVLGWLCIGEVPALILLVIFLTLFGMAGYAVQWASLGFFGGPLPALIAAPTALLVTLPGVRVCAKGVARLLPKDETEAVSSKSFVGRVATVTIGEARRGSPAEAKLTDQHGATHYVMIEPTAGHGPFPAGTSVLLVEKTRAGFEAIENRNQSLTDQPLTSG